VTNRSDYENRYQQASGSSNA